MKKIYFLLITCILSALSVINAQQIVLSNLFTDGMVLQQETEVPIWGITTAGATVTVNGSWNNVPVQTVADTNGKFIAYLSTPQAGFTPYTITVNDSVISDVLIGEVWFCSGQSNMNLPLGTTNATTYKNANVRFFRTKIVFSSIPLDTMGGFWAHGDATSDIQAVSMVGYFFARKLQMSLNIPIGMIGAYHGGTAAEEWTNPSIFSTLPASVRNAYTPSTSERIPGALYNGMINPLLPYKISGMLWYQGENNVARQQTYSTIIPAMVAGWRNDFNDATLPFYLVQLPTFQGEWREFREIQQEIAETIPNGGFVVTIDVGDLTNIHPTNKKPVGERLCDMALARVYGQANTFNSPQFRKAVVESNTMRIYFNFAEKGLKITVGESPELFEIAGANEVYYPAKTRIEGNTVLVWADEVPVPVKVRYFWKTYAIPNFFSTDNYPVAPFRMK
jgi:sialate O-acetylesterase